MNTAISIIIPNFNKSSFVAETLDSLISQSFENWEAIIIDDCSTDNSVEILRKYETKDFRFRLLQNHENMGGAYSRNLGLKSSEGEFIIFLDSDDELQSDCLLRRYQAIKDLKVDFVVFPMGTFEKKIGDRRRLWLPKMKQNHLLAFLRHDLPWATMQPIWRKSFLLSLDGFDEDYPRLQDVELHTRALLNSIVNYSIVDCSVPDCYYRVSHDRITFNYEEYLVRWVNGVNLYLRKMANFLRRERVNPKREIAALKGTFISMLNRLLHESKNTRVKSKTIRSLIKSLYDVADEVSLLDTKDRFLLRVYSVGYTKGLSRIKGFNFAFKKMLTLRA